MGLRNLLVRVGADLSGLQRGMRQANTQVSGFAQKASKSMKMVKAAMAAVGSALVIGPAIKDASKFEAMMGTLSGSLGGSMKDFIKWQNTIGASLGYSKLQSADLANTLSLNFKQIANSQKDLLDKTTKMMETAAVISSKRGMAMTEVSDRIRSAMNQEADGADELGVNVRVNAMQQSNAYKQMADGKPWAELSTNMQKAILYHHILESVSTNLGDTLQNNTAMKMSAFTASLLDTRLALGQAFLPILNVVLPVLTSFMRKIEGALQYVSAFSRALFGTSTVAKQQASQTKATTKQASAVTGLGNAIKDTAKEAKKASRGVAGFDEINQLADPASSGSSGGSSGGDGGDGGITPIIDPNSGKESAGILESISKKAKKLAQSIKKFFKNSTGWDTLKDAWKRLKDSISDLWKSKAMKSFVKWLKGGWGEGIDGILMLVAGAVDILAGAIDVVTALLNGDWKKAWSGVGKILRGFWEMITGLIGPLFPGLTKKMKDFGDYFFKKWDEIKNIKFGELALKLINVFIDIKKDAEKKWTEIKNVISTKLTEAKTAAAKKAEEIWAGIKGKFTDVYNWFKKNVGDKISSAIGSVKETVKSKAEEIWNGIKSKFTKAYSWFKTNVADKITTSFQNVKSAVVSKVGEIWSGIKGKFSDAYSWFKLKVANKLNDALFNTKNAILGRASDIWLGIKGKFNDVYGWFKKNVADKVSSALHTITSGVSDGFKGVVTAVINKGISLINSLISKLNSALQYIDKHLLPGDAIPNVPQIPKLAKGGITNGPTLAMVGDNPGGKEVISPLDKLKDIVASAVGTAVMQANQYNRGSNLGGDIVLNIDGRTFARIVKPFLDKENKRIGPNVKLKPI